MDAIAHDVDIPVATEIEFLDGTLRFPDNSRLTQRLAVESGFDLMGQFAECCGLDGYSLDRANRARKVLVYRLLAEGRLPSYIAAVTSSTFAEVMKIKKRCNL